MSIPAGQIEITLTSAQKKLLYGLIDSLEKFMDKEDKKYYLFVSLKNSRRPSKLVILEK